MFLVVHMVISKLARKTSRVREFLLLLSSFPSLLVSLCRDQSSFRGDLWRWIVRFSSQIIFLTWYCTLLYNNNR